MSLLRLLSAGKSLVGLQDSTARYRMEHPRSMPKFGSGKNPFQSRASNAQPAMPTAASAPAAAPAPVSPTATPVAVVAQHPEPKAPDEAVVGAVAAVETPAVPVAQAAEPKPVVAKPAKKRGSILSVLLWPFRFLKRLRRSKAPKPAGRQPLRRPVQAELSLDCVKVIRNDLSDADLEVVRAKAPAAVAAVEKAETRPKRQAKIESLQPCGTAVKRASEELAEAGKS